MTVQEIGEDCLDWFALMAQIALDNTIGRLQRLRDDTVWALDEIANDVASKNRYEHEIDYGDGHRGDSQVSEDHVRDDGEEHLPLIAA